MATKKELLTALEEAHGATPESQSLKLIKTFAIFTDVNPDDDSIIEETSLLDTLQKDCYFYYIAKSGLSRDKHCIIVFNIQFDKAKSFAKKFHLNTYVYGTHNETGIHFSLWKKKNPHKYQYKMAHLWTIGEGKDTSYPKIAEEFNITFSQDEISDYVNDMVKRIKTKQSRYCDYRPSYKSISDDIIASLDERFDTDYMFRFSLMSGAYEFDKGYPLYKSIDSLFEKNIKTVLDKANNCFVVLCAPLKNFTLSIDDIKCHIKGIGLKFIELANGYVGECESGRGEAYYFLIPYDDTYTVDEFIDKCNVIVKQHDIHEIIVKTPDNEIAVVYDVKTGAKRDFAKVTFDEADGFWFKLNDFYAEHNPCRLLGYHFKEGRRNKGFWLEPYLSSEIWIGSRDEIFIID